MQHDVAKLKTGLKTAMCQWTWWRIAWCTVR